MTATASALRVGIAASLALLLAGCAVGPDYRTPSLAMPVSWKGEAAKTRPARPQLSQWWRNLGDPLLNALVDEAVAGNLDVASAKAAIREARATRRQAVGGLFPTVDGTADADRTKTAATQTGTGASVTASTFQSGFDASWELDLFGATRREVEAATYGVDAANEELRSTLLTLVGDVAQNYVEARGYQARIALARRTAASQRETAGLTRQKLEAGSASSVDAANAAGLAATTAAEIPSLESSLAQSIHRLGVLTGRSPASLSPRMAATKPIPSPRRPPAAGLPADVLLTRPDVRRAERQLAQYTAKIGQAEAALYPSVSLTGSISTTSSKIGDLAKRSTIGWSYGPSVNVPLFQGGSLRAAVDVAKAQRDQYFVAFKASVLTALEDVENALVSLAKERQRAGQLATAASNYREAARLARELYRAGSSDFLDVLDAERSAFEAEDALLQSRVLAATDYVALNKALGGGWDRPVDVSKPEVVDVATGPRLGGQVVVASRPPPSARSR
ncbi:efflux transporter outer membrane subunit [Methylopila turkensis]|uniref:RND transporter n=1 Tax=Methylopila turkensis TaxID=1437816 RepID=A0A9W6N700_9HYPH|nr:efflux transporter outer membrane subunit [Methylopila turkensis]GLK79856.1 RND transporter [Methylopila turkensis]